MGISNVGVMIITLEKNINAFYEILRLLVRNLKEKSKKPPKKNRGESKREETFVYLRNREVENVFCLKTWL